MHWSNKYKVQLSDFLEFLFALIGFTASLVELTVYFTREGYCLSWGMPMFLMAIIAYVAYKILKIKKIASIAADSLTTAIQTISEDLKNGIYDLEMMSSKPNNNQLLLLQHAERTGQNICMTLAMELKRLIGEKVSISILVFKPKLKYQTGDELKNAYLTRFSSDNNFDAQRQKSKKHKLVENTSFLEIVTKGQPAFKAPDLIKYNNTLKDLGSGPYLSTIGNWQEYYLSEIVVPIRMELKHKEATESAYDYRGFLCADAKSANAFRNDEIEGYEKLMRTIADYLYIFFDKTKIDEIA
ncbi:MAG: hypothetical protein ACREOO_00810 [bacterium]